MKSEFLLAFNQICSARNLSQEVVLDALRAALVVAYRRYANSNPTQNITANVSLDTGAAHIYVEKQVVEKVADAEQEISVAKARRIQSDAKVGDLVMVESTPKDFGRIAAQNAKQIILQRIREAEREAQYEHFVRQEGEIVHGTVHSIKPHGVLLHLAGTEAILPRSQQVPGERHTLHQRIRAYVLEVRKTGRGPQITLSRSHKSMLRRLLELEVPEIFNGAVEIKSIAREAGSRSKVAVAARQPGVDPVGACVGMRGVRIQSIVNELGGEKIDVIEWDPGAATFIAKALGPAKVLSVHLEEDPIDGRTANVVVPDDQLSLAIGRAGQNARLAAKLTGWRIDIQSIAEAARWALEQVNQDPDVLPALGGAAELVPMLASVLRRHEQARIPYTSEDLLVARRVIEAVRDHYASIRNAERKRILEEEAARLAVIEAAAAQRREAIEAARQRIPAQSYEIQLTDIGLSVRVFNHLNNGGLATVGDVLERLAEGDEGLLRLDGFGPRSLAEVKERIDALDLREPEEEAAEEEPIPAGVVETAAAEEVVVAEGVVVEVATEEVVLEERVLKEAEEIIAATPEPAPEVALAEEPDVVPLVAEPEVALEAAPAVGAPEEPEIAVEAAAPEPAEAAAVTAPTEELEVDLGEVTAEQILEAGRIDEWAFDFDDDEEFEKAEKLRQSRQRRRELVFDEDAGVVVARRRRKRQGEQPADDWDEL
jgi:N utilization substance protein A